MLKRIVLFSVFFVVLCLTIYARGNKDGEAYEAENPAGFTDTIDINEKKPGKYNFFIQAKDKAANTTIAGPENIYIDPESDLPVTTIINPRKNMRVQGNLNIVGICVDDDGVDHVELVITRGAPGDKSPESGEELLYARAEGAEFWSFFLDTTDQEKWTDGVYTITAWGVDINGLSGISDDYPPKIRKRHQVAWNLDRKKPETTITSHEMGALVAGRLRVSGTVFDGNKVQSLSYSIDGGNRYLPVSLKYDKRNNIYHWGINVNTMTFEDGPAVIWFRAIDGMGNRGVATHLFFVNNTAPVVNIVHPEPDIAVNGIFTVAGYAAHPVGLKSLSWRLDKQSGEFPLIIGNPWWTKEFDIRGLKGSSVDLEILAVDLSGNKTTVKRKLRVDQNADMPRINLEEPAAGFILDGHDLTVKGLASDNEGVASIFYSIDAQPPEEIPCSGHFRFTLTDLPVGTHTLDIWAKDITDVTGPKTQIKGIVVPGNLPEPRIAFIRNGAVKPPVIDEFYTGMVITPVPKMVMDFAVKSEVPLAGASISIGYNPPVAVNVKSGKDGLYHAEVPVPLNLDSGLVKMELRANDRYGREAIYEEFVYIDMEGGGGGGPRSFQWIRPNISREGGHILITSAEEVILGLGGALFQYAALNGEGAEHFRVNVDEYGRLQLRAGQEGIFGPLSLNLTGRGGESFSSNSFTIIVDFSNPSFSLSAATEDSFPKALAENMWVQNQVSFKISGADSNRIKSAEYSLDLGLSWKSLLDSEELDGLNSGETFERTLDISSIEDGTLEINVRLTDGAGRSATRRFMVRKDTHAPQARLIMPIAGAKVNGTINLAIAIEEAGSIKTITYHRPEYREPESEEVSVPAISKTLYPGPLSEKGGGLRFLDLLMESTEMPLDETMSFFIEDEAGNSSVLNSWPFIIDTEMDIPIVHITLPLENEVIISDFVVSGVMYDDDAVKQIYWHIDDGEERVLEAGNGFSIPIAISTLTDNEHSVTVTAEDIFGVKSEPVTRGFRVSLAEPVGSVLLPSFDDIVKETVRISGTASDKNGIEQVLISLDSGNTYNKTHCVAVFDTDTDADNATDDDENEGAIATKAEWYFDFNSIMIKDGTHVVFIKVFDKYGISAVYSNLINIDNTPPEVTLDVPRDGILTTGRFDISGRAADPNLEEIVIELRSLDGAPVPDELKSRTVGLSSILMERMDMSELQDGLYNIIVRATDKAENITRVSRAIELVREGLPNFVDILYPMDGEYAQGSFNLYGYTGGADKAWSVTLRRNDRAIATAEVSDSGYYCFSLDAELLENGLNELVVYGSFSGGHEAVSPVHSVYYQSIGAWVTIDSLDLGDFAYERPWLSGRAGYVLSDEEIEILADRKADKERRTEIQAKVVDNIDLSFDNGGTFVKTGRGKEKGLDWSYRLETGEMTEGFHYIIVRATMENGDVAVSRTLVQVDKTPPVIKLIAPQAGGRYNQTLEFTALASDNIELKSMSYHLRPGDKAAYEVPGFIQGLYFEFTIPPFIKQIANGAPALFNGGATYMDFGMGLSFFDDNVKIQVQYGFMTPAIYHSMGADEETSLRYGGSVLGLKILATVYTLPFGSFAGPDWEWLSASFALGANFSLFDIAGQGYTQSGSSTWISALVGQIEFPKVTIPKRSALRTFSMFTEGQLWFTTTDVDAKANDIPTVIPSLIVGLRAYIF